MVSTSGYVYGAPFAPPYFTLPQQRHNGAAVKEA